MSGSMLGPFTAGEASRLSGVKYRTLDFWDKSGFISPSTQVSSGTGSRRLYSFRDIVQLKVASRLRDAGVSLQALRKIVGYLREIGNLETPLAETYLVTNGNDVYTAQGDKVMSVLKSPGQMVMPWVILDLSRTVKEVNEEAEKLVA